MKQSPGCPGVELGADSPACEWLPHHVSVHGRFDNVGIHFQRGSLARCRRCLSCLKEVSAGHTETYADGANASEQDRYWADARAQDELG